MPTISSFLTFPCISWWVQALNTDTLILDKAEHFQKMSYRNRYRISGANNSILLSIPLVNGRNQHVPMGEVKIFNEDKWQVQHWRTLVSVYKRTPYFEHYEDSLRPLFEQEFLYLADFNKAALEWVIQQLRLRFGIQETSEYLKEYPEGITDLRNIKNTPGVSPKYYQVFEDRIGFMPDLSILDILFSEGPATVGLLNHAH